MTRIEHRADVHDIEQWVAGFEITELAANGWSKESLTALTTNYPALYLFLNSQLAACFIYQQIDKNHYEVMFLGTATVFRRKGLQEKLIAHFYKLHEAAALWLECRADNQSAISLYHKVGFVQSGLRPRYYKDGMDAILMSFSPKTES